MNNIIKYGLFYQKFDNKVLLLKHTVNERCDVSSDLIAKFSLDEWSSQGCE